MKIINSVFSFEDEINGEEILKKIERAGRTAYKSEEKITDDSAREFIARIVKSGHYSVLEHVSISVRIVCDRAIGMEMIRHRIASYTMESTRYVNYSKDKFGKEITVICPFQKDTPEYFKWETAMKQSEIAYFDLISLGATPQEARSVLPNSLKTELVMTANLREWRHFFELRTAQAAHPQMRELTIPMLKEFKKKIPIVFDDIMEEKC